MKWNRAERWTDASRLHSLLLAVFFFLGIGAGVVCAGRISGDVERELTTYLTDYLALAQSQDLGISVVCSLTLLYLQGPVLAFLCGVCSAGILLLPLLAAAAGFFPAYAAGCLTASFGGRGLLLALAGAAPAQVRLGSTGPQAPGVELRLENVNPETRQGEIVAKTPSAMIGYYKNPDATKEVFTEDGWFRTGDLGEFSADGWLYIKGRLKNMIVGPSGENIYPEDIESVLNSHVCVADSVVTEHEGRLVALVHFNTDALEAKFDGWKEDFENWKENLKKEVVDYVNSKVNRFSRISEVVEEKQEFVKTPTQKIRRFLYTKRNPHQKHEMSKR